MAVGITFGGNDFQTDTILTAEIDHASLPTVDMRVYELAHANASVIPFVSYPSRIIKISGTLIGTSVANLDTLIDTFKGYLNGIGQNLDIDYNGGTRRYIATVNSNSVTRPGYLNHAKFTVEFICTSPFGQDTTITTALSATGRTSATYSDGYTFLGNAPYQLPIATITYSAVTGGTAQYVQWGNGGNGQTITVTRDWLAGDILEIDCVERTVKVNGFEVAFTGAFPEFPPSAQTMLYGDGFSARTFAIDVEYVKRYF